MEFETVKISDLISEISMGPFGSNIKVECFVDSGIPVLNGSNLDGFVLKEESFRYVTKEKADSLGKANASRGDIVITHRGTLGQIVFIPDNSLYDRYVISQSQFRVKCNEKVLPEYLVYYFHTMIGQHKLLSNASQVGVPALARASTTFQEIDVDIPSMNNQRKIVKLLEIIRQKEEVNNRTNDNLSKLSQLLYLQLSDSVSGNNEQPLSEFIDIRDGTHDSPKSQTFGYPLITSKHLLPFGVDTLSANFISQSDYDKINERSKVNTYDILFSMIGTVGLVSLVIEENVDFAIKNVGLFKTSEHPDLVPYIFEYLKSYKTSVKIDSCLAGSTQKYISLGELRKLPIVIPTPEQLKNYNSIAKPIIKQIASLTAENKALAQLRDSLLPKLMSGEIDVSNINF